MATTYSLIASTTVTGSANTLTFSAIPQTYEDLIIKFRFRHASNEGYRSYAHYTTNDAANHNRSFLFVVDSTTTFASSPATNGAGPFICGLTGAQDDTSGFFGTGELTILNYASSLQKTAIYDSGHFSAQATTWAQGFGGNLRSFEL